MAGNTQMNDNERGIVKAAMGDISRLKVYLYI